MNDQQIEQEIQAKGLTAPRVKPEDITANIADVEFVKHVSKGGQVLRWAILTTQNGFAVVGKPSVSVSPENDNEQIGRQVAYDNSRNELWPLMGYALKERLHAADQAQPPVDNAHVAPGCELFVETAITFDEFVEHGRAQCIALGYSLQNGMPWSFTYRDHAVTHETDQLYLLARPGMPESLRFTPDDLLVISADGSISLRPHYKASELQLRTRSA